MTALIDEVRGRTKLPPPALARQIRLAAHVSQARLAAELGVGRVTVARWETGTRRPRGAFADAYAKVLNDLQRAAS